MNSRFILAALALCVGASAQSTTKPAIATGQYNSGRTSANLKETVLNPSNVNSNQFGKLFSWPLDGWVFAQPLYVPGVAVGMTTTDVVYVATMHNSVYAFDANNPGAAPLWKVSLGSSVTSPTSNGCPASNTGPELGILGTPVIDQSSGTLYAVAAVPSGGGFVHYLHALDITTGKEKTGSPVLIQASVSGTGYDAQNGKVSLTSASTDIQRTALLLANGSVYAAFGNCGPDNDPWHGWVVGYSTTNLQTQTAVFNSTPNGGQGGIWQSGIGLVADSSGDLYFNTGNATTYTQSDSNVTSGSSSTDAVAGNYPMRFLKLSSTGQVLASFPPPNYTQLNNSDLDFSSAGPLLIPGTSFVVTGGKDGVIYLFDPTNLSAPKQSFQATGGSPCSYSPNGCDQIHSLAFWNSTLYVWGTYDVLRAYQFNSSTDQFNTTPVSQSTVQTAFHPAGFAVSGNSADTTSGIVWALTPNNKLHAFNAANVSNELWNSDQNSSRDGLPSSPRFTEPTIANGRVYVATQSNALVVYGLLSEFSLSTPTSQTAYEGSPVSFSLNLTTMSGFNGPVSFSVSGLPAGATASFSPSSMGASGSTTVTVNTASSTPTGTYNLIISGTAGGVTHSANVSLVVTTPDTTAPQWTCCTYTPNGSSYTLGFSGWDTQSGMKSIQALEVVNATVSIPNFQVGTNSPINFSATESGWSSYVEFELMDVAGNVSYVDPCWLDGTRQPGRPVAFEIKHISQQESVLSIVNQTPGVTALKITAGKGNGVLQLVVAGLHAGENRVINIASLLPTDGSETTVSVTLLGAPGGRALMVFAPGPVVASN